MKRDQAEAETAARERFIATKDFPSAHSISAKTSEFALPSSTSMSALRKQKDGQEGAAAWQVDVFFQFESFAEAAATTLSSPSFATP
jgi:hypothetical protein